jgi:Zn-dependent protease with chaperone function
MIKIVASALLGLFLFLFPSGKAHAYTVEDMLEKAYTRYEAKGLLPDSAAPRARALALKLCREAGIECRVAIIPHGPLVMASDTTIYFTPEIDRYSDTELMFFLSHELGHIMLMHRARITRVYKKYWPGELTRQLTDNMSLEMRNELSSVHKQTELEADEFAVRMLARFDIPKGIAISILRTNISPGESYTHPSVGDRISNIEKKFWDYR